MKFISGLVVGFIVCYVVIKNDNHSTVTPIKIHEEDTEMAKKDQSLKAQIPAAKVQDQEIYEMLAKPKGTWIKETIPTHAGPEPIKKKTKIQFSLQDIMTMESEWANLPNQIQVSKEERGWRVKMLAPKTVFTSTGLIEGNLITYDSIRALGDEGNSNLPYRISTILNHVSVQ
ncbi:MAG: hypothetical protein H7235_09255 [Bdellovibrionaceae bacterium]|nr:hypothetical protein [Pseudobdellovibrionaceae bacterium]